MADLNFIGLLHSPTIFLRRRNS